MRSVRAYLQSLNEMLFLAIGTRRVWLGANVLELEDAAGFGKGLG